MSIHVVTQSTSAKTSTLNFYLHALEVLDEAGTVSFLGGDNILPRPDKYEDLDVVLDAWTLYMIWEQSGAWEALQNDYRSILSRSMNGLEQQPQPSQPRGESKNVSLYPSSRAPVHELKLADKYGLPCDNPTCQRIHGQYDGDTGARVRLTYTCSSCYGVHYCSADCKERSMETHRRGDECSRLWEERKIREADIKKKRREVQCETCKRWFPTTVIKKCSRCRAVNYCSTDCQKKDWIHHKPICIKRN